MKQYNRNISFYKILSISIVIISSIIILFYIFSYNPANQENNKELKEEVSIEKSVLEGADKNGKTYVITSESVHKKDDNLYYLEILSGIYNAGKIGLGIVANLGIMNDQDKILSLKHNITIDYSDYKIKADKLEVNLFDMSAKNHDGVSVLYNNSNITADSFELNTNNHTIHFHGNVKTYIKASDFK